MFMSTVAVRVDDKLKQEATELFNSLGLDMSQAVRLFLIQSVNTQSIPFEIRKEVISDVDFQKILERKIPIQKISISDKESIQDFFGDEDFSEYEGEFNV